jgi:GAF domain-containing protein
MEVLESPRAVENRLSRLLGTMLQGSVLELGFDAATITARHGGDLATIVCTDHRYVSLDDAQYENRQGPCLDALERPEPVHLPEVSEYEDQWLHFVRAATLLGVRSSLSLHVPVGGELAASLNLYSTARRDLGDEEIRTSTSVAQRVADALEIASAYEAAVRLAENLAEAMRNRAVIEQAKGMLMADRQITASDAFAILARLSQHTNVKVREVARELVERRSGHPASQTGVD